MRRVVTVVLLFVLSLGFLEGCSSRDEEPVKLHKNPFGKNSKNAVKPADASPR
jgi:hypothetical protein